MPVLSKLVFLADMLEAGRDFTGVDRLRALFWSDLDVCFYQALKEQVDYLHATGKSVYPLTEEAFEYEKSVQSARSENK